ALAQQAAQRPPPRPTIAATLVEPEPKTWQVRYYHNDQIGTPRELTGESGEILWSATYKAWGNTLQEEWLPEQAPQRKKPHQLAQEQHQSQNLRFQGQYYDAETGLHYNRFRYYDPDCGRFVSQDPIGLAGGLHLYQYSSNPVAWIDPLGLSSCSIPDDHKAAF
ncbi:RHS repeat domain-containing protein, partial [Lampropedia aestuarii]|uniref:RHS repeat domain-containing protein n=1 Tax=Lampropedia aestuarii TaxID=2562762 RepID=UPI00246897B5